jgi:hypothetical protein
LEQVVQVPGGVGAEPEAERGGEAVAIRLRVVPVLDVLAVGHARDADRGGLVDLSINVEGASRGGTAAAERVDGREVCQQGALRDDVDRPARGAEAEGLG